MKFFLLIGTFFLLPLFADVVVVVHKDNPITELSQLDVKRIFLGKSKSFSTGAKAIPIDQINTSKIRHEMYKKIIKKSTSQLKAYWSKLVFTGKGSPPLIVDSDLDVLHLVAANPNMIGYMDSSKVDDTVKIVFRVD